MTTALHSSVSRSDSHPPGEVADFLDAADQAGDPSAPATGKHRIYAKSGGVYIEDEGAVVVGPLGTGATFDATPATDSAPGDTADPGAAVIVSRLDHVHGREAWGVAGDVGTETFGATAAAGATGKVADAGHVHPMPADPSVADILDLPTAETDTALVLAPDGVGGVEFRAEAGGPGGGSYEDLSDVDMTGIVDGQVPVWDDYSGLWVPGNAAGVADILDIPTAETDTSLRLAPDGAGGVEFVAGGAGGAGGYAHFTEVVSASSVTGTFGATAFANGIYSYLIYNSSNGQNDQVTWTRWLDPGTYTLIWTGAKNIDRAIMTVKFDGTSVGTLDLYNGTLISASATMTGLTLGGSSGAHTIQVIAATRNGSASGWYINWSELQLIRTA